MNGANAGDPARSDLAFLGDEGVQKLRFLIVDEVDLLDAEAANFLAAEKLLLTAGQGLIPTRGALRGSDRTTTFGLSHIYVLF